VSGVPAPAAGGSEVLLALAVLCETPHPAHARVGAALELGALPDAAEYTHVFGLSVVPYAAVYLGPEGMLGGEAADRVAGFWRAVGHVPPAEPDHLAALLGLYAGLADAEAAEADPARVVLRRRARSVLLWEHLLSWVPGYAQAVAGAGSAFYADWAALLIEALVAETSTVPPPDTLSQHLREAPGLPDEIESARALAQALLTPVRSGFVLTRRDLARAAREQDLGLRVGERAFVLASMLEQDAAATLDWLAIEADRWAERHRHDLTILGPVAAFWADRAETTAAACRARQTALLEVLAHVV
jgi:TorA maturation chaperone TorD